MNFKKDIDDCLLELHKLNEVLPENKFDSMHKIYSAYSLIRVCTTFEGVVKSIISEYFSKHNDFRVNNALKHVFSTMRNPSYQNVKDTLNKLDDDWAAAFKKEMQNNEKIRTSVNSLINCRNDFAHSCNFSASFKDIESYFADVIIFLSILEEIVLDQKTICKN